MKSVTITEFLDKCVLADQSAVMLLDPSRRVAVTPEAFVRLMGDSKGRPPEFFYQRVRTLLGIFYEALGKAGPADILCFGGLTKRDRTRYVALRWRQSPSAEHPSYTIMTARENRELKIRP